ncbi:metallophosphoesterase [bacterium]|nr:metallophosphoesterase [bacterium]
MRLIIFLVSIVFLLTPAFAKSSVEFVHITDVNLTPNSANEVYRTIKEINSYPNVDFVVFGGNNIAKPNYDNLDVFCQLLRKVNKKTIVLLGSSDVFSGGGLNKKYYMWQVKLARNLRHNIKTNYVFKKNGIVFVVMDGSKQFFASQNGYYSPKELMFLDKTLSKYKNYPVVILQHFPILPNSSRWLETAKYEDYNEIISKHNNVKAIISGHYGKNSEQKINNVTNIITESYTHGNAYKIIQMDFKDDYIGTYLVK